MKLEISRYKVRENKEFSKNIYEQERVLYKICSDYESYEVQEILTYIYSMPKIDGVLGINDLLSENGIVYGYTMPKLDYSVSLQDIIENNFTPEAKCYLINEITNIIKKLHKYMMIGDVRLSNILIYDHKPIFIDLENGQKINENKSLLTYYNISNKKYTIMDDIFKLFIVIMSILFNKNFEYLFVTNKRVYFDEIIDNIDSIELKTYYEYLKSSLNEDVSYPIYFTDIFSDFTPDVVKDLTEKELKLKM